MTKLRYIGPHTAVDVPLPPYGHVVAQVARGETYDFPAELAPGLLEQTTNWEAVKSTAKPAKDGD